MEVKIKIDETFTFDVLEAIEEEKIEIVENHLEPLKIEQCVESELTGSKKERQFDIVNDSEVIIILDDPDDIKKEVENETSVIKTEPPDCDIDTGNDTLSEIVVSAEDNVSILGNNVTETPIKSETLWEDAFEETGPSHQEPEIEDRQPVERQKDAPPVTPNGKESEVGTLNSPCLTDPNVSEPFAEKQFKFLTLSEFETAYNVKLPGKSGRFRVSIKNADGTKRHVMVVKKSSGIAQVQISESNKSLADVLKDQLSKISSPHKFDKSFGAHKCDQVHASLHSDPLERVSAASNISTNDFSPVSTPNSNILQNNLAVVTSTAVNVFSKSNHSLQEECTPKKSQAVLGIDEIQEEIQEVPSVAEDFIKTVPSHAESSREKGSVLNPRQTSQFCVSSTSNDREKFQEQTSKTNTGGTAEECEEEIQEEVPFVPQLVSSETSRKDEQIKIPRKGENLDRVVAAKQPNDSSISSKNNNLEKVLQEESFGKRTDSISKKHLEVPSVVPPSDKPTKDGKIINHQKVTPAKVLLVPEPSKISQTVGSCVAEEKLNTDASSREEIPRPSHEHADQISEMVVVAESKKVEETFEHDKKKMPVTVPPLTENYDKITAFIEELVASMEKKNCNNRDQQTANQTFKKHVPNILRRKSCEDSPQGTYLKVRQDIYCRSSVDEAKNVDCVKDTEQISRSAKKVDHKTITEKSQIKKQSAAVQIHQNIVIRPSLTDKSAIPKNSVPDTNTTVQTESISKKCEKNKDQLSSASQTRCTVNSDQSVEGNSKHIQIRAESTTSSLKKIEKYKEKQDQSVERKSKHIQIPRVDKSNIKTESTASSKPSETALPWRFGAAVDHLEESSSSVPWCKGGLWYGTSNIVKNVTLEGSHPVAINHLSDHDLFVLLSANEDNKQGGKCKGRRSSTGEVKSYSNKHKTERCQLPGDKKNGCKTPQVEDSVAQKKPHSDHDLFVLLSADEDNKHVETSKGRRSSTEEMKSDSNQHKTQKCQLSGDKKNGCKTPQVEDCVAQKKPHSVVEPKKVPQRAVSSFNTNNNRDGYIEVEAALQLLTGESVPLKGSQNSAAQDRKCPHSDTAVVNRLIARDPRVKSENEKSKLKAATLPQMMGSNVVQVSYNSSIFKNQTSNLSNLSISDIQVNKTYLKDPVTSNKQTSVASNHRSLKEQGSLQQLAQKKHPKEKSRSELDGWKTLLQMKEKENLDRMVNKKVERLQSDVKHDIGKIPKKRVLDVCNNAKVDVIRPEIEIFLEKDNVKKSDKPKDQLTITVLDKNSEEPCNKPKTVESLKTHHCTRVQSSSSRHSNTTNILLHAQTQHKASTENNKPPPKTTNTKAVTVERRPTKRPNNIPDHQDPKKMRPQEEQSKIKKKITLETYLKSCENDATRAAAIVSPATTSGFFSDETDTRTLPKPKQPTRDPTNDLPLEFSPELALLKKMPQISTTVLTNKWIRVHFIKKKVAKAEPVTLQKKPCSLKPRKAPKEQKKFLSLKPQKLPEEPKKLSEPPEEAPKLKKKPEPPQEQPLEKIMKEISNGRCAGNNRQMRLQRKRSPEPPTEQPAAKTPIPNGGLKNFLSFPPLGPDGKMPSYSTLLQAYNAVRSAYIEQVSKQNNVL